MRVRKDYQATWEGVERSLPVSKWSVLTKRSTTFLYKYINIAKDLGVAHENLMQYALDAEITYGKKSSPKRTTPQKKESERKRIQREIIKKRQEFIYNMGVMSL